MQAKITVKMDNAAFENRTRAELARILRALAESLDYGETLNEETKLPLHDSNGNNVGYLTITA